MQKTTAKPYIYNGVGARDLYIDEAHTALDIFRFAAFFFFNSNHAYNLSKSSVEGVVVVGGVARYFIFFLWTKPKYYFSAKAQAIQYFPMCVTRVQ